jgi:hypothetical protein
MQNTCDMGIKIILIEAILGIVFGAVVSILPLLINLLALILGLAILVTTVALVRGKNFIRKGVCIAAIFGTIAVCSILPNKELDQKIEPFQYCRISLGQLQDSLWEEHRIYVYTHDAKTRDRVVNFNVPGRMSKRMVLEKLVHETNLKLYLGACGTNSTILSGPHYCFTSLEP